MRFVGEEVAAVAATDDDAAFEAAALIKVEYEPLPAVLDLEKAMQPDAAQLHAKAPGNVAWPTTRPSATRTRLSPSST